MNPQRWVLKGAFALDLRLGLRTRTTKDIDLAGADDEQTATADLIVAQAIDLHDHFSFDVTRTPALDRAETFRAVRYSMTTELAGQEHGLELWDHADHRLRRRGRSRDRHRTACAQLLRHRSQMATYTEQRYLAAMTSAGEAPYRSAEIARRFGAKDQRGVFVHRDSLIQEGPSTAPPRAARLHRASVRQVLRENYPPETFQINRSSLPEAISSRHDPTCAEPLRRGNSKLRRTNSRANPCKDHPTTRCQALSDLWFCSTQASHGMRYTHEGRLGQYRYVVRAKAHAT